MIEKVCEFEAWNEAGPTSIPLHVVKTDSVFEKVASHLVPDVANYIAKLKPLNDSIYVLNNALGASEWWSSNKNGDFFSEESLIHKPDGWTGDPTRDKVLSKDWTYGFPTFYNSGAFAHHRNKDPKKSFGTVELVAWNDAMKRVELVHRIDKELCYCTGNIAVWDKLKAGQFLPTSMGAKILFDYCSVCTDHSKYQEALATFDPKKHRSPDFAIVAFHRLNPIRGVAETRKTYCEHATKMMNRILDDGRKVGVYNPYPKFFDESYVFVGADRTAFVLAHLAGVDKPSEFGTKTASFVPSFVPNGEGMGKFAAVAKSSEMTKDVMPLTQAKVLAPGISAGESALPRELLNDFGRSPIQQVLSTLSGLGILLRPQEFQRISLVSSGASELADQMEECGMCCEPEESKTVIVVLSPQHFDGGLARKAMPYMAHRSALGPFVENRIGSYKHERRGGKTASHRTPLLHTLGAAYGSYRKQAMEMVSKAPEFFSQHSDIPGFEKLSSLGPESLFTPLAVAYLRWGALQ